VIRDLLIHPYAKKTLRAGSVGEKQQINQGDVFEVAVETS
jgi:hypothetical protein